MTLIRVVMVAPEPMKMMSRLAAMLAGSRTKIRLTFSPSFVAAAVFPRPLAEKSPSLATRVRCWGTRVCPDVPLLPGHNEGIAVE